MTETMTTQGEITKRNDELRVAYGWASVCTENGRPVLDLQKDMIEEGDLVKAVHSFVLDSRAGKVMHNGAVVADVVETIVFTADLQKALGIDTGRTGWFIGMKIHDEALWKRVQGGEFPMFSIGGRGERVEV